MQLLNNSFTKIMNSFNFLFTENTFIFSHVASRRFTTTVPFLVTLPFYAFLTEHKQYHIIHDSDISTNTSRLMDCFCRVNLQMQRQCVHSIFEQRTADKHTSNILTSDMRMNLVRSLEILLMTSHRTTITAFSQTRTRRLVQAAK